MASPIWTFPENTIDLNVLVAKMPRRTSEVRLEMETFDNLNVIESARLNSVSQETKNS